MDMDKIKQWIEISQSYQSEQFWKQVFSQKTAAENTSADKSRTMDGPLNTESEWPIYDLFLFGEVMTITIELAGIHREDIELSLKDDILAIRGRIRSIQERIHYYVKERKHQQFERLIKLPYLPERNTFQSAFQNGLLTITYKIPPQEEPVKIDIQPANEK
ncbi:Hsp20/alpha crystallin family protein [Bacillus sp. MUM 13]|uniref:Hsp20/alpha crystallin family protein n=1 Tax=Bacillus sp. MUM 13 TaxID=1678001 RepID=UPI0008F574CC|nr:Hsp20/alpha crystallin family protein [Bacillus sp. MUM 13]OIK09515.1 hypothetical protein BIV59_16870 [Bacillus sp. MUM 13]